MTRHRILFALAGAGSGNGSRFRALVEALDPDRYEVALIAQAHTLRVAPPGMRTFELRSVTYGRGTFTPWSILRHNGSFPQRFLENRQTCARALDEVRPDVLVVDSDIHCLSPARRRGVPIVSVNSSPATVALFLQMQPRPAGLAFSYHGIERLDRWLQLKYADRILCPVLAPVDTGISKVRLLPPIVRRQFLARPGERLPGASFDVAVMLGGSGLGTSGIDLRPFTGSMIAVGGEGDARIPGSAERVTFTLEPAQYLAQARVAVIQGGFNSVSEVLALRKPAVIVPIPGHAEQHVNARTAEQMGLGVVARPDGVVPAIDALLRREPTVHSSAMPAVACDGAARFAEQIAEVLAG